MELAEYQERAMRTRVYRLRGEGKTATTLSYAVMEVCDNAGALAGEAKKVQRDDRRMTPERRERLIHKAGGALWGLAALADELGVPLEEIAQANLDTLEDRAARGVLVGEGWQR